MLKDVEGVLIDLDGTIFNGDELIPGAIQAISYIRSLNKKIMFLSNRGNYSREMCFEKLTRLGVEVLYEEIILSSTVTAMYLQEYYPKCSVWTLGDVGLKEELEGSGVKLASAPEEADFLVITLHENLSYYELNRAFQAVQHGARILATNSDKTFPNENGKSIDVAGMIGAIEAATGKRTELVFGKPSHFMVEAALRQLALNANQCMIIGDSLGSDIEMGKMHGMKTLLVLSGNTSRKQLEFILESNNPDYVCDSINEIINEKMEVQQ
ncbi:HAD-IIA family hydrolase [Metabacillus bambusae]|uniref:Acid sugar phosphatase n=1 Tax=Metabacillus bambusae TaxID=2795218 RepID=A0ABS3NBF4_9BACI|nr:HAD-IIA family hydrolase [Metabacillus bambusae]MBO1515532.1 HAD-IIA family hydrolase [Metabacillus bambusae]